MSYSALQIANRLLSIAAERGATLDPLKLMKLTYISHGWSFPNFERPLVRERVQAWQYGPVIPELYQAVKKYRYSAVPYPLPLEENEVTLSEEDESLLNAVFDVYGKYSGGQLSNLTHRDGTPWAIVWHEHGKNSEIPNGLIAEHYERLAKEGATRDQGDGANTE